MQQIPYASAIGSLMYAQVCTRPDIAYIVGMLDRYLSNPGKDHWIAAKRVRRYLQRTKDYMLTYRKSDQLDIKFLVVKERVQSGLISIEHIGTNSMIADPLTKGLPPKVFHEHTAHMGVVSLQDVSF